MDYKLFYKRILIADISIFPTLAMASEHGSQLAIIDLLREIQVNRNQNHRNQNHRNPPVDNKRSN